MTPPAWLDGVEKSEWKRFQGLTSHKGVITVVDRAALTGYVVSWSNLVAAAKDVQARGVMVPARGNSDKAKGEKQALVKNPSLQMRDSQATLKAWCRKLRFTPAGRLGMDLPSAKDPTHKSRLLSLGLIGDNGIDQFEDLDYGFPASRRSTGAELPGSDGIDHVICATHIHAGEDIQFSGNFVYAYRFGWGTRMACRFTSRCRHPPRFRGRSLQGGADLASSTLRARANHQPSDRRGRFREVPRTPRLGHYLNTIDRSIARPIKKPEVVTRAAENARHIQALCRLERRFDPSWEQSKGDKLQSRWLQAVEGSIRWSD